MQNGVFWNFLQHIKAYFLESWSFLPLAVLPGLIGIYPEIGAAQTPVPEAARGTQIAAVIYPVIPIFGGILRGRWGIVRLYGQRSRRLFRRHRPGGRASFGLIMSGALAVPLSEKQSLFLCHQGPFACVVR